MMTTITPTNPFFSTTTSLMSTASNTISVQSTFSATLTNITRDATTLSTEAIRSTSGKNLSSTTEIVSSTNQSDLLLVPIIVFIIIFLVLTATVLYLYKSQYYVKQFCNFNKNQDPEANSQSPQPVKSETLNTDIDQSAAYETVTYEGLIENQLYQVNKKPTPNNDHDYNTLFAVQNTSKDKSNQIYNHLSIPNNTKKTESKENLKKVCLESVLNIDSSKTNKNEPSIKQTDTKFTFNQLHSDSKSPDLNEYADYEEIKSPKK